MDENIHTLKLAQRVPLCLFQATRGSAAPIRKMFFPPGLGSFSLSSKRAETERKQKSDASTSTSESSASREHWLFSAGTERSSALQRRIICLHFLCPSGLASNSAFPYPSSENTRAPRGLFWPERCRYDYSQSGRRSQSLAGKQKTRNYSQIRNFLG